MSWTDRRRLRAWQVTFALLMAGAPARADGPRWAILHYLSTEPISTHATRPIIAYTDPDGRALDWLFDAVIVYDIDLYHRTNQGVQYPRPQDVDEYLQALYDDGQLATLADLVAELRVELDDPGYRLKVYLTAPYLSGPDASLDTQRVLDGFTALDREELELVGFYWGYEENAADPADPARMSATADFVHGLGYELIWIPYADAPGATDWASYGFDRVTMQVNYAFRDVDTTQFQHIDDVVRNAGMVGVELEFGPVRNDRITDPNPEVFSARQYLTAASQFNWVMNDFNTCYHASELADYAESALRRPVYDGMYRAIAVKPRRSVLPRVEVVAHEDAFVEMATGYQDVNHGADDILNVGTNSYPNALRTLMKFSLADGIGAPAPLAAHVRVELLDVPYGSSVDDAALHVIEDAQWDEASVTGQSQPADGYWIHLAPHRFVSEALLPRAHAFTATEAIVQAMALGREEISFGLRRDVEDGTAAEVTLASREHADAAAPTLVWVAAPAPGVGAGGGGAAGAGGAAGGVGGAGGASAAPPADVASEGCGCRTAPGAPRQPWALALWALVAAGGRRRRSRTAAMRTTPPA